MDHLNDPDYITLININNLYGLPDYVGEKPMLTKEAASEFDDESFADVVNRRYPITSKADVWLSAAYHTKKAEFNKFNEYVQDKILKAAEVFGIKDDVEAVVANIESDKEKTFIPYEVSSRGEYKDANAHYFRFRNSYLKDDKRKYSIRLVKSAKRLNLEPDARLYVDGRIGMPDFEKLSTAIEEREIADFCRDELESRYTLLKQAFNNDDFMNHWGELTNLMEDFDRETHYKNIKLASLTEAAFAIPPEKVQKELDDIQEIDGQFFSLTKLASLGPDFYHGLVEQDLKNKNGDVDKEKLADALKPRDAQRLIHNKLKLNLYE